MRQIFRILTQCRRRGSLSVPCRTASQLKMSLEPDLNRYDEHQIKLMNEMCISVDSNDRRIGPRTKKDCHLVENIDQGLLHRAFSVLLFNTQGQFLITQRSDAKITFPGYFTNACCSHPLDTDLEADELGAMGVKRAAQRRMFLELGVEPTKMPIADMTYMTRIMYKAPSSPVWGEHEIDYLIVIQKDVDLKPDPNEVKSFHFLHRDQLEQFIAKVETDGGQVSPWFKVILKSFLYKYWSNLKSLKKLQDHKVIHQI